MVCGADEAKICLPPNIPSDSLIGVLLHGTQELRLQFWGEFADLIDEQRATRSQRERTVTIADSACKCAALVAKELAAGQARHQSAAVQYDQVSLARARPACAPDGQPTPYQFRSRR